MDRVLGLVAGGRRAILGIVGLPGAGKSTFADALAAHLNARRHDGFGDSWVARVPMDGFHLADEELVRLGRSDRKGAADTFDVGGYVALLDRLARDQDEVVYAPAFDRVLEQPVAGSIAVTPAARLVITEGNYLLHPGGGWSRVRRHLDEVWFIDLDEQERHRRLIGRHVRFGKSAAEAQAWALGSDQSNAELISASADQADLHVDGDLFGRPRKGVPTRHTTA